MPVDSSYQPPSFGPCTGELWMRTSSKYQVPTYVSLGQMHGIAKEKALR